jgi:putative addiction module killer protein
MYIVRQTETFLAWLDGLRDVRAQVRISARIRQIEAGNLGDWKPIEGKVSELRIAYGPGYRLYFTRRGNVFIVLLAGGDKSTQMRDIRRAMDLEAQIGDSP